MDKNSPNIELHSSEEQAPLSRKEKMKKWFKRLGWAGFLFFFIKGLVWLVLIYLLGWEL